METSVGRHALLQSSMSLYKELIEAENIDCEWQEVGLMFVYDNEKDFENFAKTEKLVRENFGVGATPYAGDELCKLEPAIKPGFGGAWHYESDCHIRPDKLMMEIKSRLLSRGVEIIEDYSVESFVNESGRTKALHSTSGHVEADHFVVATGAMTPFLNKHLGLKIPIEPGKGYSLTMPRPPRMPKIPIIFEDSHVAITPMKSGYRIGSTMEFVGYDTSINKKRLGLLTAAAEKYLYDPHGEPIEEEWFGWRPMTWDGRPIIDRCPILDNVWIAAGHSMLGLSMATGTGKLVSEMLSGEETHIDVEPFSVSRF